MKKVFISYSHKDKDWVRGWLLPRLENAGIATYIDFRDFEIGPLLLVNVERAVEQCAKTLLVLSPGWVSSEGANFENALLQTRDPLNTKKKIIPLMLHKCKLPRRLEIFTWADFRNEDNWDSEFNRVVNQIKKDFKLPYKKKPKPQPVHEVNVDISRLPETGFTLFGRQNELKILDEAWQSGETRIVSFVAFGGVGKSTLVNKWLEKMRWDNYRGAEKVYGCSFYSQGTGERVTSADKFISQALAWFGDLDPTKGSPWDKGQRLADLIRKKKTLLILDGLEPLQSDFEGGKIKDAALSMLVTQLARRNDGLCVITTRLNVAELARFDKGVEQLNLDQISREAGRALLRVGGIQGTDTELETASDEFGNHALAINLLASFIHDIPGHHIKNATQIGDLDIPKEKGKHPRRVIEAFEKRFGEGSEVQLLRILGLFDRPVEMDAIKAVYEGAPIAYLTGKLVDLTEVQWQNHLDKLREYKLLARKSTHSPDIVDCHPLVREHFGEKLKKNNPEGWREAHGRLYEYYKNLPKKEFPNTLEEMEPLFSAVAHGCQAGRHQEAEIEVFFKRIRRKNEGYSVHKLGAFGSDLSALSNFFEKPWEKIVPTLDDTWKTVTLSWAGFDLRALGRLREAAQPMQAALDTSKKRKVWGEYAQIAGSLSELYLTLGKLKKAIDHARHSVEYADRQDDWRWQNFSVTKSATALHEFGNFRKAQENFAEAEIIQKKNDPEHIVSYSMRGFLHCDLLLSIGQYKEVQKRAAQTLEWVEEDFGLLSVALDKLSLGRAYLIQAVSEKTGDYARAADFLNQAVDDLREAGQVQELPRGLLARAELYRYQRNWERAWADLEEAKEIAERGQMNLYLADCELEAARLCLSQGERLEEAHEHYEEAVKRVEDMGYHRRDPEVLLIQAELEINEGNKKQAQETLKTAERRINEMGCHRWDIEVKRLKGLIDRRRHSTY